MSLSSLDGPISRRQFLKRGAALGAGAVAASMIWDSLWGRAVLAGPGKGMPMVADFLTRAQVTELLGHALAHGGDFAEVYGEYTLQTLLTVDQGKLASMEYGVLSGVGIRVLAGDQIGYAYSDDYDMVNLRQAADVASHIARGPAGAAPQAFAVSGARAPFVLKTPAPLNISEQAKVDMCLRADAAARRVDQRITQV